MGSRRGNGEVSGVVVEDVDSGTGYSLLYHC